jgi:hypothetical protein
MFLRRKDPGVKSDPPGRAILGGMGLHLGIYLAVLSASATLVFPPAIISERLLAPAYASGVFALLVVMHALWVRRPGLIRGGVAAVYLLLLFNKVTWTASLAERARVDGPQGYLDSRWRTSQTIEALRELEPGLVYTNNVAALYTILGMYAYDLPEGIEIPRANIDPNHETLEEYRRRLASTPGAIVALFGGPEVLPGSAVFEPFTEGLELVSSYSDGAIYTWDDQAGAD